jgi:hypothetical protein
MLDPRLKRGHNSNSRYFVSQHVYPVTAPDPTMFEVTPFPCDIL